MPRTRRAGHSRAAHKRGCARVTERGVFENKTVKEQAKKHSVEKFFMMLIFIDNIVI